MPDGSREELQSVNGKESISNTDSKSDPNIKCHYYYLTQPMVVAQWTNKVVANMNDTSYYQQSFYHEYSSQIETGQN